MAFLFGDGFDSYATTADPLLGYWDSGLFIAVTLVAGRFSGSQAISCNNTGQQVVMVKSSAVNDAVHHIVVAFRQTAVLSGTTLGLYFQLSDAATNQCCIVFRSDGAILLTSATPAGTVLDTYTGAVTAANTWYAFEFEITINNTMGSWAVRKNGNTSNDRATGSLNTRPGANSYANKLTVGMQASVNASQFDDLLWRSDASSVPFVGDVRCYSRMPASDASVAFVRSMASATVSASGGSSSTDAIGTSRYSPLVVTFPGTVASGAVYISSTAPGNLKATLFADNAGAPGAVLGSANIVVNPTTSINPITFATPIVVSAGTYWLGVSHDMSLTVSANNTAGSGRQSTVVPYASFPTANPVTTSSFAVVCSINVVPSQNASAVNETLQDGTTSYVYSSNPTDADFYTVAPLAGTPAATIAVVTRGFLQKSDAGTRGAAVQLKSGATTVQSTPTLLGTNFGWLYRTDVTDPATGLPWTSAAVNNIQCGPVVSS